MLPSVSWLRDINLLIRGFIRNHAPEASPNGVQRLLARIAADDDEGYQRHHHEWLLLNIEEA
jgi:hypothetical protein